MPSKTSLPNFFGSSSENTVHIKASSKEDSDTGRVCMTPIAFHDPSTKKAVNSRSDFDGRDLCAMAKDMICKTLPQFYTPSDLRHLLVNLDKRTELYRAWWNPNVGVKVTDMRICDVTSLLNS